MLKNIICIALLVNYCFANTRVASTGWEEESNIYEKIYNAPLKTTGNQNLTSIESLYNQKPLLLALVFTRCAGICNPFLLQLKENLQFTAKYGSFNILILSFDPQDTKEDMRLLAGRYSLENDKQWIFAVTDSIENLNQSVSFFPVWNSVSNQFDHDALLVGINNEGCITKKLIGMRGGHDLDLLINSMQNVFSPTYRLPGKNVLFSCFNYNPKTGKNTPGLGLLFIALPAILTILVIAIISLTVHKRTIAFFDG